MMIEKDTAPITPREAYSGDYWRQRAKLTRQQAETDVGERMRSSLAKVAAEYERLAERADNVQRDINRLGIGSDDMPGQIALSNNPSSPTT